MLSPSYLYMLLHSLSDMSLYYIVKHCVYYLVEGIPLFCLTIGLSLFFVVIVIGLVKELIMVILNVLLHSCQFLNRIIISSFVFIWVYIEGFYF